MIHGSRIAQSFSVSRWLLAGNIGNQDDYESSCDDDDDDGVDMHDGK